MLKTKVKKFRYATRTQITLYIIFTATLFVSIIMFGLKVIELPLLIAFFALSVSYLFSIEDQIQNSIRDHLTYERNDKGLNEQEHSKGTNYRDVKGDYRLMKLDVSSDTMLHICQLLDERGVSYRIVAKDTLLIYNKRY